MSTHSHSHLPHQRKESRTHTPLSDGTHEPQITRGTALVTRPLAQAGIFTFRCVVRTPCLTKHRTHRSRARKPRLMLTRERRLPYRRLVPGCIHVKPAMAAVTLATAYRGSRHERPTAHVGPVRLMGAHTRSSPSPLLRATLQPRTEANLEKAATLCHAQAPSP